MKLEIGPGYSSIPSVPGQSYEFRPHYCIEPDVVFLDIELPKVACKCNWMVADAQLLPFRGNVFDEMYSAHVIEHLEDPQQFLREIARVLKRGGMITVVTPNFLSKSAYLDPDHKHVFNFMRLRRLFGTAGLKPVYPSPNVGSFFPKGLRYLLKAILLVILDTLEIRGVKR